MERNSQSKLHCKKKVSGFPSPAGVSLTKLFLAGSNWIIPSKGEFCKWHPGWGRKTANLFLQCNFFKCLLFLQCLPWAWGRSPPPCPYSWLCQYMYLFWKILKQLIIGTKNIFSKRVWAVFCRLNPLFPSHLGSIWILPCHLSTLN